jgi:hypothetical protein
MEIDKKRAAAAAGDQSRLRNLGEGECEMANAYDYGRVYRGGRSPVRTAPGDIGFDATRIPRTVFSMPYVSMLRPIT